MSVIILKDGLYLNQFYQWCVIPHLFPWWQAEDVFNLMMGCKDKPTAWAWVKPGVVDLDALEVVRL